MTGSANKKIETNSGTEITEEQLTLLFKKIKETLGKATQTKNE